MEAMRQTWTDDRMDDLVGRVDNGFAQLDADFARVDARFAQLHDDNKALHREMVGLGNELRRENKALAGELREENKALAGEVKMLGADNDRAADALREEMNERFTVLERRFNQSDAHYIALNQRFDALQGAIFATILAGFIGLIVTNFS